MRNLFFGLITTVVLSSCNTRLILQGAGAPSSGERLPGKYAPATPDTEENTDPLKLVSIYMSGWSACGLTPEKRTYCWGARPPGWRDAGYDLPPYVLASEWRFESLASTGDAACGLDMNGKAFCWGENEFGALGIGKIGREYSSLSPKEVSGGLLFSTIKGSGSHFCGLTLNDQTAYCWGANTDGRLGVGDELPRGTPTAVAGGMRFKTLDAGTFTCGIAFDDRLYCWGNTAYITVRFGSLASEYISNVPMLFEMPERLVSISVGSASACGLTEEGKAYCWGYGVHGQLGSGINDVTKIPQPVSGGLRFSDIQLGSYASWGLTLDGKVYLWGMNILGDLNPAMSANEITNVPIEVPTALRFSRISGDAAGVCGLEKDTGLLYCWGNSYDSKLFVKQAAAPGSQVGTHVPTLVRIRKELLN